MKFIFGYILSYIYILGIVLIPTLHQAGIVMPHSVEPTHSLCSHTESIEDDSSNDGAGSFYDDEVCLLCALASTLIHSPETSSFQLVLFEKTDIKNSQLKKISQTYLILSHSRAPPFLPFVELA